MSRELTWSEATLPPRTGLGRGIALPIAVHGAVIVAIVLLFWDLGLGIKARTGLEYDYEEDYLYDYELASEGIVRHDINAQQYPAQGYGGYEYNHDRPVRQRIARNAPQESLLTRLVHT